MKSILGIAVIIIITIVLIGKDGLIIIGIVAAVFLIIYAFANKEEKSTYIQDKHPEYDSFIKRNSAGEILNYNELRPGQKRSFDNYTCKLNSSFLNKNLAFIDFETATKERASAIQLGVTTVKNGVVKSKEWFFKPYRTNFEKDFMFTYLHGITPVMVIDKPMFHEVWEEIEKEIESCILVAHNASFDLGILDYMFEKKLNVKKPSYRYICTLELARKYLKSEMNRFGLEAICKNLDLPYGKHDGKKDTLSCLYVLNRILNYHTPLNANHDKILNGKKWQGSPIAMISTSINLKKPLT